MPSNVMTAKQQVFVDEYLVVLNASAAAIRAGYSRCSAHVVGCKLMKEPHIAQAIRAGMEARSARTGVSADRVIAELARVAFSDLGRIADWGPEGVTLKPNHAVAEDDRAAICEISAYAGKIGAGKAGSARVHIRLQNKQRALDGLARHLGLYGRNAGLVADPQVRIAAAARAREKLRQKIEEYARDLEREREEAGKKPSD